MRSRLGGETAPSPATPGKDVYELEVGGGPSRGGKESAGAHSVLSSPLLSKVLLRVKESEIRYLKREIHSLKDELQSALRVSERVRGEIVCAIAARANVPRQQDEKYAADKRKDLHSELSVAKAKADCEIGKLKEKLHIATRALGDRSVSSGYGKSPSFRSTVSREHVEATAEHISAVARFTSVPRVLA